MQTQRPDISLEDARIIEAVRPFTMTSTERLIALIDSVRYVSTNHIPGDIVECGVWRGGSMMATALTLSLLGDFSRTLHLYDTFEGMPSPDDKVDFSFDKKLASHQLASQKKSIESGIWCVADLDDVKRNLFSTNYPVEKIKFIKGKVEDTIPKYSPADISMLRLDTDWYESTRHELVHLYPSLSPHGILIIDDYGHWQGARRACDEYFASLEHRPFLSRIDYTGRLLQKTV